MTPNRDSGSLIVEPRFSLPLSSNQWEEIFKFGCSQRKGSLSGFSPKVSYDSHWLFWKCPGENISSFLFAPAQRFLFALWLLQGHREVFHFSVAHSKWDIVISLWKCPKPIICLTIFFLPEQHIFLFHSTNICAEDFRWGVLVEVSAQSTAAPAGTL